MQILLVHGLGRTPLSLFGLAAWLRRSGHHTRFFGYSPTFEQFPSIVQRLVRRLQNLARFKQPVGLIGHSLGGILLRLALAKVTELKVHRFIMLGTPNRSPRMARLAWKWRAFRLLAKSCGHFLATPSEYSQLGKITVPHTVFAGTSGPRGRLSPFDTEPNDGLVAVSETSIDSSTEVVQLPVWHSFMMDAVSVRQGILKLLK